MQKEIFVVGHKKITKDTEHQYTIDELADYWVIIWGMSGAYCQQWTAICGATCSCDAVYQNIQFLSQDCYFKKIALFSEK